MTEQEILKLAFNRAFSDICEGSCADYEGGSHRGECKVVRVEGWGHFSYCDEAIAEDTRRGFDVEILNDMEVIE